MGFVRFTTRAVSRQDTKPSQALVKLNAALLEELETGNGEFCTAAVVRIRPHDEGVRLTVAVAGHPLPLILRANGDVEEAGTPGTVLGVFEEIEVSDTMVELHAGDALVMLTDGVLEAGRDPDWESKVVPRLLASCTELSPDATADRIKAAVADLEDRRTDDVAVLVLKVRP
jgi:serine phosphatase RsbU (regulator of sigma subunit)